MALGTFREWLRESELNEAKYNYDIDGKGNPYIDLPENKLVAKKKSFLLQLEDLKIKLSRSTDKKAISIEIDDYELKLKQINYALKK